MTEEEQKEFEKKWKEAEAGGQTTKAQSAQLICIPGDVPYRIREHVTPSWDGPIIYASTNKRAYKAASLFSKTTKQYLFWATMHFAYNAVQDGLIETPLPYPANFNPPNPSSPVDPIRNEFFSFFDDRRLTDAAGVPVGTPEDNIALKKQFGNSYWEKESIVPTIGLIDGVAQTLQSKWKLLNSLPNADVGALKYFYPRKSSQFQAFDPQSQLIEIILSVGFDDAFSDPGFPLIPGSRAGRGVMEEIRMRAIGQPHVEDLIANLSERSFLDTTFVLNKPFAEKAYSEALGEAIGLSDPVKVQAHYNFYLVPYENITKDNTIVPIGSEPQLLPNLYGIMVDAKNEDKDGYVFKHADNWQYLHKNLSIWRNTISFPESAASYMAKAKWGSFAQTAPNWPDQWGGTPNVDTHNEYLNKFAMALKKGSLAADTEEGESYQTVLNAKRYSTTGLSAYQLKDFMDEADKIKKFFPMHANIEIPASNKGKFGKILYDADMFDQFMQLMMAVIHPLPSGENPATLLETAIVKKDSKISGVFENLSDANKPNVALSLENNELYYEPLTAVWLNKVLQQDSLPDMDKIDIMDFWNFVDSTDLTLSNPHISSLLNELFKIDEMPAEQFESAAIHYQRRSIVFGKKNVPANWINNIKWALNKNKISQLIKEKTRSVSDVYEGKLAHSEVLFYEIVKFHRKGQSGTTRDTFIQNIFLPNTPETEVLKYVDTQVKFGQEYYYQVYAHTLVIGTQYQLENMPTMAFDEPFLGHAYRFNYKFAPSIRLIRVPYYNTYVTMQNAVQTTQHSKPGSGAPSSTQYDWINLEATPIWDKPPVFPDIVFHPLYGEKNKILINSNFNVGEYDLEPIPVDGKEQENLDVIRRNQKKLEGPVTFRGDDFCGHIEVLRIEKKPLAYSDFSPTENTKIAILGGTSHFGEIIEQEPNKEYYYMARAIDKHGNYSNPSPIYQTRIVAREGEAPYAIFNMFFIEEAEEKKPIKRKNLMKYIRIQPSFDQSFLDSNQATINYDTVKKFENLSLIHISEPTRPY